MSSQDHAQGNLLAAISGYDRRSHLALQDIKLKSTLQDRFVLAWRLRGFSFRSNVPVLESNYR
jgi:hypothetical protein